MSDTHRGSKLTPKSIVSNKRLPLAAWTSTMARLNNVLKKEADEQKKKKKDTNE